MPGLAGVSPFPPGPFLFSSFSIPTLSLVSLELPVPLGFLGRFWERKGQIDTGGNSRPCSLRGLTRPLPQFLGTPGLPCFSSSPSGSLFSGQSVKPHLGFAPSLPLVILLEVERGQPGPAQPLREAHSWEPECFLILGSPDKALRTILCQPHRMSSHAPLASQSHPLLLPLFSSGPEATVTVTWPPLPAPPSQGFPWAGPLTSFGKSGLCEIKEEAHYHCLSAFAPTPSASGSALGALSLAKDQPQKGPATPGVKQTEERTRDPLTLELRRVPAFQPVPTAGKG